MLAEAIVEKYIGYLRTGIDNYINLYAPDRIVLGGGISKGLRNDATHLLSPRRLHAYKAYQTTIAVSDLEEQAGVLAGAALL